MNWSTKDQFCKTEDLKTIYIALCVNDLNFLVLLLKTGQSCSHVMLAIISEMGLPVFSCVALSGFLPTE